MQIILEARPEEMEGVTGLGERGEDCRGVHSEVGLFKFEVEGLVGNIDHLCEKRVNTLYQYYGKMRNRTYLR